MTHDDDTEVNPLYVRHQLCLQSLEDLREVDDIGEKVNGTLCALAAFYDGVSEEILAMYFDHVGIPYVDPVVERVCRDAVNVFHVADLLRVVDPPEGETDEGEAPNPDFQPLNWIDPSNEQAFRTMVEDDLASFMQDIRTQARKFRGDIELAVEEYISTHS